MSILLWVLVFVGALWLLLKASDWFVESAEEIGLSIGISPFVIGMTFVALGTSLPELASSVAAVLKGADDIVIGNVIGSNVANILLVLSISTIIGGTILIKQKLLSPEILIFVLSAAFLSLTIWDGKFTMIEGVLALIGIVVYLFFIAREERKNTDEEEEERPKLSTRAIVFFLIGMALIPISAHFTVEAMVNIAQYLEVGNSFISQTALAIGTSLPELFVSVAAVRKAKFDIALGNVIGSNIFNTFIVMGVPALITTLTIPDGIRVFSLPVMLVATLLMILFMLDKKIKRWEGIILLIAYIGFIGYLITHNLI